MPKFRNEGPQQFVVELQRHVANGEEFEGSAKLADVHGFVPVANKEKPKASKDEE